MFGVGISTTIKHVYEIMGDEKVIEYLLESVENLRISDENGQYTLKYSV